MKTKENICSKIWKPLSGRGWGGLLFALLFFSCSSDDDWGLQPGEQSSDGRIRFEIGFAGDNGTYLRTATDAGFRTTWETDDEIGVFIVKGNGGLQASGNFADNVKLTRETDGTWKTDAGTTLYYPNDGETLSFYAYYPYDAAMTDPTGYTFSVKADQSGDNYNKSDLLLAKAENVPKSGNAVQLQFAHALSLVQVEVKREVNMPHFDGDFRVTLTSALPDAKLNWASTLTGIGTATGIEMHQVDGMDYTYRALVPAQALDTECKVTFTQNTADNEIDMEYPGVKDVILTAGKVDKRRVTLGWGIDPEHQYAVGDVYPHIGPAMGIVYWLEPGTDGKHGKAVSLDQTKIAWSSNSSTTGATDQNNGRSNMRTIYDLDSDFSGYPAFAWVHGKNASTENYSDIDAKGIWYLPSKEGLKALFAGFSGKVYEEITEWNDFNSMPGQNDESAKDARAAFNDKLVAAGGTAFSEIFYWSSSESDSSYAWIVKFNNGNNNYSTKSTGTFDVRCVLAF